MPHRTQSLGVMPKKTRQGRGSQTSNLTGRRGPVWVCERKSNICARHKTHLQTVFLLKRGGMSNCQRAMAKLTAQETSLGTCGTTIPSHPKNLLKYGAGPWTSLQAFSSKKNLLGKAHRALMRTRKLISVFKQTEGA